MAGAKAIKKVPRAATSLAIKRSGQTYTGTWKLPSNATSNQRNDRTEKQKVEWQFVQANTNTKTNKTVAGDVGTITGEMQKKVGTLKSTLKFNTKTNLQSYRKNFYPYDSGQSKPVYKYEFVTAAWYKQHKDDRRYNFTKAKKKNKKGQQYYYLKGKTKKYVSDDFYNAHKDEKKYTFVKVQSLIDGMSDADKKQTANKNKIAKWQKYIKNKKIYRAQSVKSDKKLKYGKIYAIRLVVRGGNSKGWGKAATKTYTFAEPAKPTISLAFDNETTTFNATITSGDDSNNECIYTSYTISVTEFNAEVDEEGFETETDIITETFSGKEAKWSRHVTSAEIPLGGYVNVTIKATAYGLAGSAEESASYKFGYAEKPVIEYIQALVNYKGQAININDGLKDDEYQGHVLVKLASPVGDDNTEMSLERIVLDDPDGTEYDTIDKVRLAPNTWDVVQTKTGSYDMFGEPVTDVLATMAERKNGVPYGQRVFYRVCAERDELKRRSDPKEATTFWRQTPTFANEELDFLNAIPGGDGESVELYLAWNRSKFETGYTETDGTNVEATVTEKDTSNEISWSDKEYAWTSNKKPETFDMDWRAKTDADIAAIKAKATTETTRERFGKIVISGLTEGRPYWFKGRRHLKMDDIDSYSDIYYEPENNPITPVSSPDSVSLSVPDVFVFGKDLRCDWSFSTKKDDRSSSSDGSTAIQKAWALYARYKTPAFWYKDHEITHVTRAVWLPGSVSGTVSGGYVRVFATLSESSESVIYTVKDIQFGMGYSTSSFRILTLFNEPGQLGSVLNLSIKVGNHDTVNWTYEAEEISTRSQTVSLTKSPVVATTDDSEDPVSPPVSVSIGSDDLTFVLRKTTKSQNLSLTFTMSGRLCYSESSVNGTSLILGENSLTIDTGLTIPKLGSSTSTLGTSETTQYIEVNKGLVAAGGTDPASPDASSSYTIDYDTLFGQSFVKVVQNGQELVYNGPSLANGSTFDLSVSVSTGGEYTDSDYQTITMAYSPTCDVWIPDTVTDYPVDLVYFSDDPNATAIATITSHGMSRMMPDGEDIQSEGDYVWSSTLNSTELLPSGEIDVDNDELRGKVERFPYAQTVRLEGELDLWDGCEYTLSLRSSNDETGLSSETVAKTFYIDWSHKATAPSNKSLISYIRTSSGDVYTKLTPKAPDTPDQYTGDLVDIYRVTPDGAHLVAAGVQFGQSLYDKYPPFSKVASLRYIFCTRCYNGDVEWCEIPYSVKRHGLRFDWAEDSYLELPYNIKLDDSFEKNSEVRSHIDGTRNLYSNNSVRRTASLSAETLKLMEPEQQERLRELARYTGPVLVRAHDGTEYAANVNVSGIDNSYDSLTIPVSIETEEIDMTEDFILVDSLT